MGIFDRLFKPNVKKLKKRRDIQGLSEALGHKDRDIRSSAAEALGDIALSDEDSAVREKACECLIRMGEIDHVIRALEDKNKSVRQSAANTLGDSKDKDSIRPLIKALQDSESDVRKGADKALKHFETAEAMKALRGYEVRQREERITRLDYVVGRHMVKYGCYKKQIGTEMIRYFDPLKVVFRLFDEHGRRITASGSGATAFFWPPDCGSEEEQMDFMRRGQTLAQALEAYPGQISLLYMISNPLGEMEKLLPNLERVGEGEVD